MATNANVWLVRAALEEAAGDDAADLMHWPSKALDNQTPLEVAEQPGGANVVLAALDRIVAQARDASRGWG
jgi:uncharacterized protein (DUF2384 family)